MAVERWSSYRIRSSYNMKDNKMMNHNLASQKIVVYWDIANDGITVDPTMASLAGLVKAGAERRKRK